VLLRRSCGSHPDLPDLEAVPGVVRLSSLTEAAAADAFASARCASESPAPAASPVLTAGGAAAADSVEDDPPANTALHTTEPKPRCRPQPIIAQISTPAPIWSAASKTPRPLASIAMARDAPHAALVERSVVAALHAELPLVATGLPDAQRAWMLRWVCAQMTLNEESAILSSLIDAAAACLLTRADDGFAATGLRLRPVYAQLADAPVAVPGCDGRRPVATLRSAGLGPCAVIALEPAVLDALCKLLSSPTLSPAILRRALALFRRLHVARSPAALRSLLRALAALLQRQGAQGDSAHVGSGPPPMMLQSALRTALAPLLEPSPPKAGIRRSFSATDVSKANPAAGACGAAGESSESSEPDQDSEDDWDDWDESDTEEVAIEVLMQEGGLFLRSLASESATGLAQASYPAAGAPRLECPRSGVSPLGRRFPTTSICASDTPDSSATTTSTSRSPAFRPQLRRAQSSAAALSAPSSRGASAVASPAASPSLPRPDFLLDDSPLEETSAEARWATEDLPATCAAPAVQATQATFQAQSTSFPPQQSSPESKADSDATGLPAQWIDLLFDVVPNLPHQAAEILIAAIRSPSPE